MKIGLTSRHCENCKREVHDFTSLSRSEILQILFDNKGKNLCGRIYKSQLDYHHEEMLVTIEAYLWKNRNSNLTFYLLAIGSLALLSCSTNDFSAKVQQDKFLASVSDTTEVDNDGLKSDLNSQDRKIDSLAVEELELLGVIAVDDSVAENGVRIFAEVMPEFVGGFDNLFAYIKKNLVYPDWERKAGIEGMVFVSFIINEEGKIIEPKIVRSVEGAKHFDTEVLRIFNGMPDWKPGQERGENVAVQFTLPIKFKL